MTDATRKKTLLDVFTLRILATVMNAEALALTVAGSRFHPSAI